MSVLDKTISHPSSLGCGLIYHINYKEAFPRERTEGLSFVLASECLTDRLARRPWQTSLLGPEVLFGFEGHHNASQILAFSETLDLAPVLDATDLALAEPVFTPKPSDLGVIK